MAAMATLSSLPADVEAIMFLVFVIETWKAI